MQRRLTFGQVMGFLPEIKAQTPQRIERVKTQISGQLEDIRQEIAHEQVNEDIMYQKEQLDMMTDFDQLAATFSQLLKQKKQIIQTYQQRIANLPPDFE